MACVALIYQLGGHPDTSIPPQGKQLGTSLPRMQPLPAMAGLAGASAIRSLLANITSGTSEEQTVLANITSGMPEKQSVLANISSGTPEKQTVLAKNTSGTSEKQSVLAKITSGTPEKQSWIAIKPHGTGLSHLSNPCQSISDHPSSIILNPTHYERSSRTQRPEIF